MQPPVAPRRPVTTDHHGRSRTDDYEWLRDKDDPHVVAHLEAENAWTEQQTAHLAGLREAIFEEIRAHTVETDLSVPSRIRGHWYYSRSFEGKEYGASCRLPVRGPDDWVAPLPAEDCPPDQPALPGEQVLLDLNELAEGHDFFSLGGLSVSPDEQLLAFATDTTGDERFTIEVKDLAAGDLRPDRIEGAHGGATWHPDGSSFYYCTPDEAWRSDKVWRHVLGTGQEEDELVFHESDERFWVGIGRSRTDRFLMIASGSKTTTELHVLDTASGSAFECYAPRVEGVEYSLEHAVIGGEDCFLVMHNASGPNFELARGGLVPSGKDEWEPLLAHSPEVRLEDVSAYSTHLVVNQRSEGLTQLRILDLDDHGIAEDRLVEFPDELYTIGGGGNSCFDDPLVRLGYTSMRTPASIHDLDTRTRELHLLKQRTVRDYDPEAYEEHRLWATAPDGAEVPISLVHRRGLAAPFPIHLYGYGAYEASIDPAFSIPRLSLLDRGAAMAIAHVRGGGEMGRLWYDDGKLAHKQHTFDDFVVCARHLRDSGLADNIVAEGASAGGLLIGAVANQAPDLFDGLLANVPFVDALTTMLDSSLPLTVTEYDEWGNPEADPAAYDTIAAYDPYTNVSALDYPPILAETSLQDTRVLYVEPAKWVARLRERATGRRDFLLKTELAAGHGGVSGRYKAWRERAFELAWILDRMGLAGGGEPVNSGSALRKA